MLSSSRILRFTKSALLSPRLSGRPERLVQLRPHSLLLLVCIAWNPAAAQSGVWTWMGGSSTVPGSNEGQPGDFTARLEQRRRQTFPEAAAPRHYGRTRPATSGCLGVMDSTPMEL